MRYLLTICLQLLRSGIYSDALRSSGVLHLLQLDSTRARPGRNDRNRLRHPGLAVADICGVYRDDFTVRGSDEQTCQRWPSVNLCEEIDSFCKGNLQKQRCEMPQLEMPQLAFQRWKAAEFSEGIEIVESNVSARELVELRPSQSFLNRCTVCALVFSGQVCFQGQPQGADASAQGRKGGCYFLWSSGVSVSEDGFVLDGHHRWAAAKILLSDAKLSPSTAVVTELYKGASGQPVVTVDRVLETAAKHPELVKHTWCDKENDGASS